MPTSLTSRFERFLDEIPGSASIDVMRPQSAQEDSRADYFLCDGKIIAEIKTLKEEQRQKGEKVLAEYLDDTGIKIFGTLPLSRIARSSEHLASIEETIYRRMTRGIEKICSSAHKQISSELSKLPHLSTGLLIILNEGVTEMHPRLVADRVTEFVKAKPTNIHYCLLISECHKVRINHEYLPYPLLLDLTYSARQRRVKPFLKDLQQRWAKITGHAFGLPDPEPLFLDYQPGSITFGN